MVSNERLDAALAYADRGWPVFPCHHPTRLGCSCGVPSCHSPAKHPATARGLHNASTDPSQIERWWRSRPQANVAIRTGQPGGLLVLDVDLPAGPRSLARFDLSTQPSVRTGSGGAHLYFRATNTEIRNSAGRLGPGLDVRGDGGYVIAPPSRHANGEPYIWTASPIDLPALPSSIERALRRPVLTPPAVRRSGDVNAWADAVLDQQAREVRQAPEGTRNYTLNRAAFRVGRLAARGDIDPERARSELEAAAQAAGLSPREAARTTDSGLSAGLRQGSARSLAR